MSKACNKFPKITNKQTKTLLGYVWIRLGNFLIGKDCMMVMDNRELQSLKFTSVVSQKGKKWITDQSEGVQ